MRQLSRPPRTRPVPPRSLSRHAGRREQLHDRLDSRQALTGDAPRELAVEVRQDRRRPLVIVEGELDLASAGLLTAMLDHVQRSRHAPAVPSAGRGRIDVDLSGVTFADSHGLGAVLDGRTRVVAASAPVRRLQRLLADLPGTGAHRVRQQEPGVA